MYVHHLQDACKPNGDACKGMTASGCPETEVLLVCTLRSLVSPGQDWLQPGTACREGSASTRADALPKGLQAECPRHAR